MTRSIAHLTSAHPADDIRIFFKQCRTLESAGYDVTLIARSPRTNVDPGNIEVIQFFTPGGRASRMLLGPLKMLRMALAKNADLYVFHDPELIPVGFVLKLCRKRVIYDVHEDVPAQIMSKQWIPTALRRPVASVVSMIHRIANKVFDGIMVAREDAAQAFHGDNVALVQNYPMLEEFSHIRAIDREPSRDPVKVVYVGSIRRIRGIFEMLAAVEILSNEYNVTFELAGPFETEELRKECMAHHGWENVHYHQWVDRDDLAKILAEASVGLLIFLPVPNHITSYPNKLFEYMSAGLPIVASNFEYWHQYVSDVGSGVLVDPKDPTSIAAGIREIVNDPASAKAMGEAGSQAVQERWSWDSEAQELLRFVNECMGAK